MTDRRGARVALLGTVGSAGTLVGECGSRGSDVSVVCLSAALCGWEAACADANTALPARLHVAWRWRRASSPARRWA